MAAAAAADDDDDDDDDGLRSRRLSCFNSLVFKSSSGDDGQIECN